MNMVLNVKYESSRGSDFCPAATNQFYRNRGIEISEWMRSRILPVEVVENDYASTECTNSSRLSAGAEEKMA